MTNWVKPLVSMELDDEDKLEQNGMPICSQSEYPWGLRITLTQSELEKLGLDPRDAFVGGTVHGFFMAKVTSVSMNDSTDGANCRVELQIQDLGIESEDEEDAEEDAEMDKATRPKLKLSYK